MKTVADLQPGDIVNISDQPFTVKSVYTSGGSTTLVFEDVPATQERCDALKGLARCGRHCCDGAGTPDAEAIVGAI